MKRPIRGLYQNKLKKLIYKNFNRFCPCLNPSLCARWLAVVLPGIAPSAAFDDCRWCVLSRVVCSRLFACDARKTTLKHGVIGVIGCFFRRSGPVLYRLLLGCPLPWPATAGSPSRIWNSLLRMYQSKSRDTNWLAKRGSR